MRTPVSVRSVTLLALAAPARLGRRIGRRRDPVDVYRRGAGGAEFRSDVRIFNPTNAPVNVTPILYDQVTGQTITKPVETIPPRSQKAYDNIVGTLFGKTLDDGAFGPIRFQTPDTVLVSSSVNNYNACGNGSVSGQWLPGLDAASALTSGTLVQLASSADTRRATARTSCSRTRRRPTRPSTRGPPGRRHADLGGHDRASPAERLHADRQLGSPVALRVDTTTTRTSGSSSRATSPCSSFASVINNASGDPFAIVMTAEPNVSASGARRVLHRDPGRARSPGQAGDVHGHVDELADVTQFWAFGDGTRRDLRRDRSAHVRRRGNLQDRASSSGTPPAPSSATKDVVVGDGGPDRGHDLGDDDEQHEVDVRLPGRRRAAAPGTTT